MPNRWSRHSVPSPDYEGMYEYSKTAYRFETKEDALLFKLNFPGAKISDILNLKRELIFQVLETIFESPPPPSPLSHRDKK